MDNIIKALVGLSEGDAAGAIGFLPSVASNKEDIEALLTHHNVDKFHKIGSEILFYHERQLVFSGTIEDGVVVSLWSKSGKIWEKK